MRKQHQLFKQMQGTELNLSFEVRTLKHLIIVKSAEHLQVVVNQKDFTFIKIKLERASFYSDANL